MTLGAKNSLRLFRIAGIDVYLHWTWLLVAFFQIGNRADRYSSMTWNIVEYLTLFFIVLLHEFGHALACRQVGGAANKIMLWPLGGVAYISPPQRPGAILWSIAAGPLVNVALFFVLTVLVRVEYAAHGMAGMPDLHRFLYNLWVINVVLLVFNLLPIYPLDGGQIVRALLWFPLGRTRSLFDTVILGFIGVALLALLAFYLQSIWMGAVAFYVFTRCRAGLTQARVLRAMDQAPRRTNFPCPSCEAAPPIGPFWRCPKCRTAFDAFENDCTCPSCQGREPEVQCLTCRANHSFEAWRHGPAAHVES